MDYFSYKSPMDREYFEPLSDSEKSAVVPMGEFGVGANPMKDQVQELKTRIFQGASKVELQFMGVGKGSMGGGNTTPEMYGKDQRQAMRELAKINRIQMTTHSAIGLGPLSGLDREGFSKEQQSKNIFEIQRSVDFAAEVARGGPIVVHASEWQRSPLEAGKQYGGDFRVFDFQNLEQTDNKPKVIMLADRESGSVQGIRTDHEIFEPIIEKIEKGIDGKDIPRYKYDGKGELILEKKDFSKTIEDLKKDNRYGYDKQRNVFSFEEDGKKIEKSPEEMYMRRFFMAQYEQNHARSLEHNENLDQLFEKMKKSKEDYELQKEIERRASNESKDVLDRQMIEDPETGIKKLKSEIIKDQIQRIEKNINYYHEYQSGYAKEAASIKDRMDKFETIEKVGLQKTAETLAMAAMYAKDKEDQLKKQGVRFEKHLFIAPENIFVEQYGGHPQELKKIVQESREKMAQVLYAKKKAENLDEARKIAKEHIKATFDIGHANTWRKYYTGSDADFNKWLIKEVDDLVKNDIIGHVHITDNFGYEDEHLTAGQGNAPLKEFIEKIRQNKKISINVETAHQDFDAMIGAWKVFGSPLTGLSGSRTDTWTNLEGGYFGKTRSPYFIYGEFAPSDDYRGSPFWSGLPLE